MRNDVLVAISIDKTAVSRSRLNNRFLGIDVGYLILRRVAKKRSAAHEQGLLSRAPEGEEFWAVDAGGKNGFRASRGEF